MQKGTEKLIQHYYDSFNRRDWEAFFKTLHPDVSHDINEGNSEVGIPKFREFIDRMNHCYEETVCDLIVMQDTTGQHAAARFIIDGKYLRTDVGLPPASGQKYRIPVGAFFEIRDGLIIKMTNYYNLKDWIKQVS